MTGSTITPSTRTYQITSLERGLDILRVIRNADEPVRNRDIVSRTGLPKATVSRLVHTLTALGYIRRIDQGSYVLDYASSKIGRAMLEGLRLERYGPLFHECTAIPGSQACLMMYVQGKLIPVFRWSAAGSGLLSSGASVEPTPDEPLINACFKYLRGAAGESGALASTNGIHRSFSDSGWCQQWHAHTRILTACIEVHISSAALCVLVVNLPQADCPAPSQLESIGTILRCAADAIARESSDKNGGAAWL